MQKLLKFGFYLIAFMALSLGASDVKATEIDPPKIGNGNIGTGTDDNHTIFEGVWTLKEASDNLDYTVTIFGKIDFTNFDGEDPYRNLYISVIGEGHIPLVKTYHLGSSFDWVFGKWINLPSGGEPDYYEFTPFTDESKAIEFKLFYFDDSTYSTEPVCFSVTLESLFVKRDCEL